MRFISLFSGIGGFDLGFERASMECVAQVEFNKNAANVLKRHWPKVPLFEDVRNVGKHNLPAADLICGGFPCQDVSVAGKRKGLVGERSGLWFEFLRIITECTPGWVVIENVPGLLTSNRGRDFATVIHGLVKCGYRVGWRVLDAQYDGLAQRRKRVFVVASLTTALANPAQVLFERESSAWDTPPSRETRQGIATTVIKGAAIGRRPENGPQYGEIIQDDTCYTLNSSEVHAVAGSVSESVSLTGKDYQGRNIFDSSGIAPTLSSGGNSEHASGGTHINVLTPLKTESFQRYGEYKHSEVGSTLRAEASEGDLVANAVDVRSLKLGDEVSGTLQSKQTGGWSLNYINPVAFHWQNSAERSMTVSSVSPTLETDKTPAVSGYGVRRLTPTECERLQGFPDGHTANQADSVRYKQLGNAIAVPVAYWIGKRIMDATPKAIVVYKPSPPESP